MCSIFYTVCIDQKKKKKKKRIYIYLYNVSKQKIYTIFRAMARIFSHENVINFYEK